MQFDSLTEFIAMGSYGVYVWTCFGFTIGMLIALILLSKRQIQQTRKIIAGALLREQRIKQAKDADLL